MSSKKGDTEQTAGRVSSVTSDCPACGTEARREGARYCSVCGRVLEGHYLPADALRASYHLHEKRGADNHRQHTIAPMVSNKRSMSTMFPKINRNGASTTALAFTTYALVPFLGILFVPGAVLIGAAGLMVSYRAPQRGGRRASLASVVFGLLILGVQVLLWWIIVKVPEWSNPATGGY